MPYAYPEALNALESIANDYIRVMRPNHSAPVSIVCDSAAITACVLWDDYGVRINLPVRPAASVMSQAEFEDWTAYLLHELGHPTHTDKADWESACKAGLGAMTNALEDVRMEKAVIASGIVPNAKAVLSRLLSRKIVEARASGWRPNARKEFGWTACVLGRAANGYAFDPADLAWIKGQIKPGSTVGAVMAWALPELARCGSTADCAALAKRISDALAVPSQEGAQEGAGKGKGADKDKSKGKDAETPETHPEPSNAAVEEGSEEPRSGSERQGGEGGEEPRSGSERQGEGKGEGSHDKGHGDGSTDDETPVASEKDLTKRSLAPQAENPVVPGAMAADAERIVTDLLRRGVMKASPERAFPGAADPARRTIASERLREAAARSSRQRALLARALRANETDDREGGRRAGRLDKGALTRAMAGSVNVFARREVHEGFDTDVCVLIDASGSMGGGGLLAALEAGLIVAQAASSVGAPCTVEIFNAAGYARAGALASKRPPSPEAFGALARAACNGTPLSAHMARIAVAQAKRAPHMRRVLFVVTDGGCDCGSAVLKRMAEYLEQACGTVLAHVSIGTPLTGAFRAEICVPYGKSIADMGLDHFVKVLQAL